MGTIEIARYLKKNKGEHDKAVFQKWIERKIDDEECLRLFRENNKINSKIEIDIDMFIYWLNGLGWYRYGKR